MELDHIDPVDWNNPNPIGEWLAWMEVSSLMLLARAAELDGQ